MAKTWYGHHIENIKGEDYVLFKDYLELDKEIERLNKELDYYKKEEELYRYYQQEVPRLENIIYELEKYLEDQWLEWKDCETDVRFMANEDKAILDKLRELKEGKE